MGDLRPPLARTNAIRSLLGRWEAILVLIFVVVIVFNSVASPYFLNPTNLLDTTFGFVEKGLIALPMTLGIILGDIDISVAGIIALSSLVMGALSSVGAGSGVLVAAGLGTGLAAGLLNGLLATRFGIPMIAVTIGGISLFRGIAYAALGDQAFTKYPAPFAFFGQGYIPGTHVPFELIVFVLFAVLFAVLLRRTTFGRRIFAIGNNPTAARFSGVRVSAIHLAVSCLTGFTSGLASVLLTSRIGSTRPNIASGWELEIITTVVLGEWPPRVARGTSSGSSLASSCWGSSSSGWVSSTSRATCRTSSRGCCSSWPSCFLPPWPVRRRRRGWIAHGAEVRSPSRQGGPSGLSHGQGEGDHRASPVFCPDGAAMALHDALADGKAEAGLSSAAGPCRVPAVEEVEDMGQVFGSDPTPVVRDGDLERRRPVRGGGADSAAGGRVALRILNKIVDDLCHGVRVRMNGALRHGLVEDEDQAGGFHVAACSVEDPGEQRA